MSVDERLAVVALVDGEPSVRAATVVHREHTVLHISADDPLALPVGNVVGLMTHHRTASDIGGNASTVALALVAESVGPNITALRILERRS